jgi:[ribosomal protein S18]-alanine N-acetyltransferase
LNYDKCTLQSLTYDAAMEICQWEYEKPYNVYNFKGKPNGYLLNKDKWGKELFCLINKGDIIGQIACQFDNNDNLWFGWSLSPLYCGQGKGHLFIKKCIEQIRKVMDYSGTIYLRVVAWNRRAIKAYEKAGFVYSETIQDEIAYTNNIEDFWVMANKV